MQIFEFSILAAQMRIIHLVLVISWSLAVSSVTTITRFYPVPEERLPNFSLKILVVESFSGWGRHLALQSSDFSSEAYLCLHYSQRGRTVIESKRRQSRLLPLAALDWKESNMRIAGDSWSPLCIFCCFHALLGCADPHHTFLWSSSFMTNYWRGA